MEKLITILQLANEGDYPEIVRQTILAMTKELGILIPSRYNSIREITLYSDLTKNNRIKAIKELRERAVENGLSYGLKECKDEIDRRIAQIESGYNDNCW